MDNIKDSAYAMSWARLQVAENDLKRAKLWDGTGFIGDDNDFEDTKQKHIDYAQRRVDIHNFILNLINKSDD